MLASAAQFGGCVGHQPEAKPHTCRECRWWLKHKSSEYTGRCRAGPPSIPGVYGPDGHTGVVYDRYPTTGGLTPACGGFEGKEIASDAPQGIKWPENFAAMSDGTYGVSDGTTNEFVTIKDGEVTERKEMDRDAFIERWKSEHPEGKANPPIKATLKQQVESLKKQPVWTYLLGDFAEWQRAFAANDTEALKAWPEFKDGKFSKGQQPASQIKQLTVHCNQCGSELEVKQTDQSLTTPEMSAIVEPCSKCSELLEPPSDWKGPMVPDGEAKEPAHKEKHGLSLGCVRCGTPLTICNYTGLALGGGESAHVEPSTKCCEAITPPNDVIKERLRELIGTEAPVSRNLARAGAEWDGMSDEEMQKPSGFDVMTRQQLLNSYYKSHSDWQAVSDFVDSLNTCEPGVSDA